MLMAARNDSLMGREETADIELINLAVKNLLEVG